MPFSRYLTQKELEAAMEEIVTDRDNNDESRKYYSYLRIFVFYRCNVMFRSSRIYTKTNVKYLFIEHIDAVYIPPAVDTLTDEEDMDDEDKLEEFEEPTDIVGTFELHVPENTNALGQTCALSTTEPEWDSSDDETLESKRRRILSANSRLGSTTKWKKGQIEYTHTPISNEFRSCEELKNRLLGKTPLEFFFMFFDDEVIDLILNFSVKYAQDNNRHEFSLSKNELLNFIGILYFSGYHSLPHIQHYWSTDEDKGIELIKKCMSRNRFQTIKQNLHLSDNNTLDKNDKFSKVRPFLDAINKKKYTVWNIFT